MRLTKEDQLELRGRAYGIFYVSLFSAWQEKIQGLVEKLEKEVKERETRKQEDLANSVSNFGSWELLGNLKGKMRIIESTKSEIKKQLESVENQEELCKKTEKFSDLLVELPITLGYVFSPYLDGEIEVKEKLKGKIKSSDLYSCLENRRR